MTPQSLHTLVSSLPKECWPEGLRLHTAGWFVEREENGCKRFAFVHDDYAVMLFESAIVRWLSARRKLEMWHCGDHWHVNNSEYMGDVDDQAARLGALIEAVKAETR